MGTESIEISKFTGNLYKLAEVADKDGNKVLEKREIMAFQGAVESNGLDGEEEYTAIFGSEIKATNPQQRNYSEKTIERMERKRCNFS